MSSLTLVSRLFGFVRDMIIANKLGTSNASDAFFVAMLMPNLLRRLFAEGAFGVVFVPILSKINQEKGPKAAEKFAATAYTWLVVILTAITCLMIYFMEPFLTHVLARGWANDPEKLQLATTLSQITFPYLMLITFASLCGGIGNTFNQFAPFAITPVLLNISFIGGLLILPELGVAPAFAAAYAMTFGGILQAFHMRHAITKIHFKLKFTRELKHPEMPHLLKRLGPAALAIGVLQISFVIDILLASYLEENAVSYLQFANRFYQQPLSLIGIALATVLLPHLSRTLKAHKNDEANQSFQDALTYGSALAIFSSIGLIVLSFPLIDSLFGHGEFTADASRNVSNAMQVYCLALPAYVMTKITVTCFYAYGDTKTPLIVSLCTLVINITLNLILMQYYGFLGLALATSISGYFNAALQYAFLYRKGYIKIAKWVDFKKNISLNFVINLCVLIILSIIHYTLPYQSEWATFYKLGYTAVVGLSALCTFVFLSHKLKFFNFFEIIHQIKRRKKKA